MLISRKVRIFDKPQLHNMICTNLIHGVDIVATCTHVCENKYTKVIKILTTWKLYLLTVLTKTILL